MYNTTPEQKNTIYLENGIEDFSNIAIGILIQAMGGGKRVAYINNYNKAVKLTNFIENLSLSYSFVKSLNRFQIDIYNFKDKDKISKTLIPAVEFCMISKEIFYNSLNNCDLIIIDNYDRDNINKIKVRSIIENNPLSQIILTTNNKDDYKDIKENFNIKVEIKEEVSKKLMTNKSITNITGENLGKSLYSIGYLLRNFLYKKDVKLIYFDKGDNIYADAVFFNSLKRWTIENNLYGTFDFVKTGIKRYTPQGYRKESTMLDRKEAKDTLMLLKTALNKLSPVVADELNTIINKNILKIDEVLDVLKNAKNEIIITGENSKKEILDISGKIIKFAREF